MEATPATNPCSDGPVLTVIRNRLRGARKKVKRITTMEKSIAGGGTLTKEQKEVVGSKSAVLAIIGELEKLRAALPAALDKERLSITQTKASSPEPEPEPPLSGGNDGGVIDGHMDAVKLLVELLYIGNLFDVETMESEYVTDDVSERDLRLISELKNLIVSRPDNSPLTHPQALEQRFNHARLFIANSDQPIHPETDVSYAALREKLCKIMSSDYFTAAPNMKAPEVGEGEVPAAASVGNCGSFKESLTCIISALKGTKYSFRGTTSIKCGDDKGEGSVSSQTGICFYGDVLNTFRRNTDLRKSLFVSVPVLEFVGDNSIEFVCAIGRDLGVSLYSFLTGHHPGFCWWDYTFDFRYKRVGKHFQKLGKLVVTLLYNLHVRGLYVGKDLLHLIYVKKPDKGYKSFSIALVGCSKETSYADGVWNDICGLKELVSLVQAKQPLLKRIEMAGGVTRYPTAEELFDLKIFHALIPAQKPTGEDPDKAIRDLSYFVNHTTLFWGSKEMFNFTTACYLLRESDECAFDDLINYEGYDEMVDDWGQHLLDNRMLISFKRGFKTRPFTVKIRPSNNLYESEEDLLRPSNNLYESRKGLVIYMRCILLHYLKDRREKLSRVGALAGQSYYNPDTQLWELFPYACPIIYAEVYKKLGQEFMPLAISSGLDYEIVA